MLPCYFWGAQWDSQMRGRDNYPLKRATATALSPYPVGKLAAGNPLATRDYAHAATAAREKEACKVATSAHWSRLSTTESTIDICICTNRSRLSRLDPSPWLPLWPAGATGGWYIPPRICRLLFRMCRCRLRHRLCSMCSRI